MTQAKFDKYLDFIKKAKEKKKQKKLNQPVSTIGHNKSSVILGEVPRHEVIAALNDSRIKKASDRNVIVTGGRRYSIERMKVFAVHGCKCFNCGIEGTKVILTQDAGGGLHCDLYAEVNGGYRLMNRDHILPASKGGKNNVWALRPSCWKCNSKRGNEYTFKDKKMVFRRKIQGAIYRFFHTYRGKRKPIFSHEISYAIASILTIFLA
jgi:hypothetical protein